MAVTQKEVPPSIPANSEDVKHLTQNSTLSKHKPEPSYCVYALPSQSC